MFKLSPSFFLVIILVPLAVAPAFVLGEGSRNFLLIGVMGMCPLLILKYKKFYWSEVWLLLFMASIILLPLLNQPASMRWSTVMYSFMFGVTFIAYVRLLHRNQFSIKSYQKLLMYFIYAYFVVLLIQQFCVLTGLPVFNMNAYNPTRPWKLNSLAAEPSHSARIVALLMYCYITVKELIEKRGYNFRSDFKDDKWLWLAFLWTMATMGSSTAFLFLALILLKFMRLKTLLPLFVLSGGIVFFANIMGAAGIERTFNVFLATLTFDIDTIMAVDLSASIRIVPMMIIAKMVDITTLDGWFGHGIDHVSGFLSNYIPGTPEGVSGGGMMKICIEYGFLPFTLFIVFSFSMIYKRGVYLNGFFWFMLVFMHALNTQILWLCITLLFTNNYFTKVLNKE